MSKQMHRRQFIERGLLGAAGLVILRDSRSAWSYQANEKLGVALVGLGWRGSWLAENIPKLANVAALCDVNDLKIAALLRAWEGRVPKPKTFHDFRELLDKAAQGIDPVVVATTDHNHAVVSAAAIKAGKAVYCEKPLTRTVHESRALRDLARQHKVPTAMGSQGTYTGPFHRALKLIQDGALGQVREVHVWNDTGGADRKEAPRGEEPVPAHLKWDLWLGPAAARPFHSQWLFTYHWRDFGTGRLGNWGSHSANLGFMALKAQELWLPGRPAAKAPRPTIRVSARSSGINKLSFPRWETVRWEVPARATLPPVAFTWYSGPAPGVAELLDPIVKDAPARDKSRWRGAGTLIVGARGTLHTTSHNQWFRLLPAERFQDIPPSQPEVDGAASALAAFFRACRGGQAPPSSFDYASALTEFLLLGNIATQVDGPLEFDPTAMKIINNAEAEGLLRCQYRKGWTL